MGQGTLEMIMGIIINAGNAKSEAMEAIQAAKEGDFESSEKKINYANDALVEAHHSQTGLLTAEAQGSAPDISLLLIHSQDHLMTSIAFSDIAKEVISLYKRLDEKD
ncbi:PTS lactose/cellobiose transporter subunit IIA [Vagococcus coleopterorum]|uniref:PTS lactose/cellobiose transporter subunit IIA n=1 Tax=Vagococcus coleopterorum TaxID=2714946 RepID=A0A6G8APA8_9ENTE|nr:PTS lactose/cellobiose transporter subunit IIA [Vagococcus coleopterorum]QIL46836.1 PTS lactose/cellobiose transporter subunit IIA [Vagococcus coleopterorum]